MLNLEFMKAMWRAHAPSRSVDVGWLLDSNTALFVWDAPKRLSRADPEPNHSKAVSFCPAVLDHESRVFEVSCPITVRMGFRFDSDKKHALVDLDGDQSSVRPKTLGSMVVISSQREWRHPDRPIIQFKTPYVFLSDEPVYMTQMPPITHYQPEAWPGVMIGGRLPIHIWPRQIMWAFEWFEPSKPLVFRRGDPWFHVRFETNDPSRPVRLLEAQMTEALREYRQGLSSVANYVNRSYSLFKVAEARRPKVLLVAKRH